MKWRTRWLSQEGIGRDSALSAPGQEGPGVSAQSRFVQPCLPGEAWFQKGLFSSGPTWRAPGCCRPRGARGGPPARSALRPRVLGFCCFTLPQWPCRTGFRRDGKRGYIEGPGQG